MNALVIKILQKINIKVQKVYVKLNWNKIINSNNTLDLSYQEARTIIEEINPKPRNSNCVVQPKNKEYEKGLLSIIVPVYNVEKTLSECLDSILNNKTEYKYEIICVNDGSPDNSARILDKYAKKYDCIKIITQDNKGFSGARNTGIDNSKGEFLMFVDSDDIITENAIEKLMEKSRSYDIVEGGHYFFDKIEFSKRIYQNQEVISKKSLRGQAWGKVFKRECFSKVHFPQGYWYEDTILHFLIYPEYCNAYTISEMVYGYRYNVLGISVQGVKKPKCLDTYWIVEEMIECLDKLGKDVNQEIYNSVLAQFAKILYARTYYMDLKVRQSVFVLASHYFNKHFSDFETENNGAWKYIEKALQNKDFDLWEKSCISIM